MVTRRSVLALAGASAVAQGDPRAWVPARKRYGAPVTHVATGETPGVRTLRNVRWPGLQVPSEDGSFTAGPSGTPWINTNAWAIQWERYRAPGVPVWLAPAKPEGRRITTDEALVTLADCEASGGRWVIDCEDAAFPRVAEAVRFFDAHRAWRDFVAPRHIGMVATPQPEMREVMNLMSRFAIPYRLVTAPLPGMSVLIHYGAPDRAAHEFANQGGLVISLGWKALTEKGEGTWVETRAHMRTGAGRLAAWRGPVGNAQRFVTDLKARLGEDNMLVKAYNAHASTVRFTVSDENGHGLIQLVNYTGRRWEDETTLWVMHLASKAVLYEWGAPPRELEAARHDGGTEVTIPARGLYAAIELS